MIGPPTTKAGDDGVSRRAGEEPCATDASTASASTGGRSDRWRLVPELRFTRTRRARPCTSPSAHTRVKEEGWKYCTPASERCFPTCCPREWSCCKGKCGENGCCEMFCCNPCERCVGEATCAPASGNREPCGKECCRPGQYCASPARGIGCNEGEELCRILGTPGSGETGTGGKCRPRGSRCCANNERASCCGPQQTCSRGTFGCPRGKKKCGQRCCDKGDTCCEGKCCGAKETCCDGKCCGEKQSCCNGDCCNTATEKCCRRNAAARRPRPAAASPVATRPRRAAVATTAASRRRSASRCHSPAWGGAARRGVHAR